MYDVCMTHPGERDYERVAGGCATLCHLCAAFPACCFALRTNQPAMKPSTFIMYPKDVQRITGKGPRSAQRLLQAIKRKLGKERHQFVTWGEFCNYGGVDPEELERWENM